MHVTQEMMMCDSGLYRKLKVSGYKMAIVSNKIDPAVKELNNRFFSELPCISVLWGFRDRAFLMKKGASMFAETPDEVFFILASDKI